MKSLLLIGLLVISTNIFAIAEPSPDSSDAVVTADESPKPPEDVVVPPVAPLDEKPVDIMSEDVPEELKKARIIKKKALDQKYAKTPTGIAQKDKEVEMAEFNAAFFKDLKKKECKKSKKCPNLKAELAAIDTQAEAISKEVHRILSVQQGELRAQMEAVANDCVDLQKEEACVKLKEKKKEYMQKYGIEITTDAEGQKSKKPKEKFDSKTCKWSFDLPRRIINTPAPGCGNNKSVKTCVGYVICDQEKKPSEEGEPLKVVRMSTCGPENCDDEDAAACTKQPGYKSQNQDDFVDGGTTKVKEVLKGGAVAQ